jgi:hypothetical protein
MRLTDEIVKSLGTILAGKHLIAHMPNLVRPIARENRNQRSGGL